MPEDVKKKPWYSQYRGAWKTLRTYWRAYGGWKGVTLSPYFAAALLLTAASWRTWFLSGWWADFLAVLPNMLGFTLGAFVMFITVGDEKFKETLCTSKSKIEGVSAYIAIISDFAHFIVIQIFALLIALLSKAYSGPIEYDFLRKLVSAQPGVMYGLLRVWWAAGYALCVYSLVLAFATTLALVRLAGWTNDATRGRVAARKAAREKAAREAREEEDRQRLEGEPVGEARHEGLTSSTGMRVAHELPPFDDDDSDPEPEPTRKRRRER